MNKTIGILTFHYANNYGAVLQAYALRKVINSFPDCHAEIINYVPKGYTYSIPNGSNLEDMQRKRRKFEQFLFHYCGVSTSMIHTVNGNMYDVYLAGSDQIWNTEIPEAAADYEYFFPHLDEGAKRIAYSASIGINIENIDQLLFQKYLPKFRFISLREKRDVKLITKLAGKECQYTLDPSMLLDEGHYEQLIETPEIMKDTNLAKEPYILCFWYDWGDGGFEGVEASNVLARKYGLAIKHTFLSETSVARQLITKDGGCILQSGIGEFLWYIKNAHTVVTNSFHGAVFSILFKRPLYICYYEPRRSRQENLVELFCLEERVIHGYLSPKRIDSEMNYSRISEIIHRERKRSISYLKNAIELA